MNDSPLFSIITVCYNAADTIRATLKSVLEQTFLNYEYIIIDGGSSDSTLKIIHENSSPKIKLISEKDSGIYDAMNKGIALSKGNYLYFLGADDTFISPSILEEIAPKLIDQNCDLLIADVMYNTGAIFHSQFNFKTLLNNTVHHQGAFYKQELFRVFRYDLAFKLIADFELNLRLYLGRKKNKVIKLNKIIALCSDGGSSRSDIDRAFMETNAVRLKVMGKKSLLLKSIYALKFYFTTYVI